MVIVNMKTTTEFATYKKALIAGFLICISVFAYAEPIMVVGHKNPDSDAIFAAISMAYFKTAQGTPAIAVAQGEPSPETQFALNLFGLQAPRVVHKVAGQNVILVDHNNYAQAPDDLKQAELVGIVDHHSLGGLTSNNPLYVLIEPVGCTNSIIWRLYNEANIAIPPSIAGGMLSAILSDTLVFKSPTTTDLDREAVKSLAAIAKVKDPLKFGEELFLAGEADLKTAAVDTLFKRDFKDFDMNGVKVGVGQLEVYSFNLLKERKGEFLNKMKKLQKEQGYQNLVFMFTDIQSEGTELLVVGKDEDAIGKAFKVSLSNNSAWVEGLMSRKKQLIPALSKVFD